MNRQQRIPPKVIDVEGEFVEFIRRSSNGKGLPPEAMLYMETLFLAGASMAASFVKIHGPKGSSGFMEPTENVIKGRLRMIQAINQQNEQERAAFANADGETEK